MCELLIRVTDKINEDFYLNCQCTKRGDVIHVAENGWNWGKEELKNPHWRIVKLPNVSVSEASPFLAPERGSDPHNPPKTLQRRMHKMHLEHGSISTKLKQYLADDSRAAPSFEISNLTYAQLDALKQVKPKIDDPHVIGDHDAKVIG